MKKEDYVKLSILIVMVLSIILIGNIIGNNRRLNNEKYFSRTNKNNFAMYIENDNNDYEEYKSDKWPVGYTLNESLSVCTDLNGNKVNTSLSYNNGKVTVVSNKTLYCTLYFDKIRSLYEKLRTNSLVREYRGEGYYHDETDKDTDNPFFTRPIYYWYADSEENANAIKESWNVVFAGSCWQMIRTTENGGVKLLYNGEPDIGEDESGNPTYDCSTSRSNNNAGIGEKTSVAFDGNYYYGDSYTYDRSTQTFRLAAVDSNLVTMSSSNGSSLKGKYTCKLQTSDRTCSTLYYIDEYISGSNAYAIPIVNVTYRDNIGLSAFNSNNNSLAYVGYMYGDVYTTNKYNINTSSTYNFSNKYSYNNGTYTLDMSDENAISFVGNTYSDNKNKLGKAHYVCLDSNGNLLADTISCQSIGYVYYIYGSSINYVVLSNGKYVSSDESNEAVFKNENNVLYSMLYSNNVNRKNSTIKENLDNWYKTNLFNYIQYLDKEEIYCNDRNISNYGSWNLNSDNITSLLNFSTLSGNINCLHKEDSFSTNETTIGNGALTYPIGLMSGNELELLNNKNVRETAFTYFTNTPSSFGVIGRFGSNATISIYSVLHEETYDYTGKITASGGGVNCHGSTNLTCWDPYSDNKNAVRPSIALSSESTEFSQGDGSTINPYVVEVGHNVILNDSNYKISKKKAVAGETITITNNAYTVGSFKVNGQTIIGNKFTMPESDVEITDVQVYKIINNTNNEDVIIPNSAIPGSIIKIEAKDELSKVTSFKLNGETVNSNSFAMPQSDVTITDVVIISVLDALRNNPNYILTDYIHFTNGNFIDTGIIPSNHTTEIKFDFETYTSDERLIGTSLSAYYYFVSSYNNKYAIGHDGSVSYTLKGTWSTGDHVMIYNGNDNSVIVDGETIESGYANMSSTTNLWIGKHQSTSNLDGKVYYVKVTDKSTGKLVRYMVPVIQKATGVVGLYDVINEKLYTNDGSGTLSSIPLTFNISTINNEIILPSTANYGETIEIDCNTTGYIVKSFKLNGNLINGSSFTMPAEDAVISDVVIEDQLAFLRNNPDYTLVEYLQSTGSQYINIPLPIVTNDTFETKTSPVSSGSEKAIMGYSGSFEIYYANATVNAWRSSSILSGETSGIDFSKSYVHNIKVTTDVSDFYIFAYTASRYNLNGKIYYIKWFRNDELIHYFVPVIRTSDSAQGVYDVVENIFYQGTGTFTVPE